MKPVVLSPEASGEAAEAAGWYEEQRCGLGGEFLDEMERILALLSSRPNSFPRVSDPAPDLEIRRALLPRFPYAVVFCELAEAIRVLAVCHTKRRPGYWLDRTEGGKARDSSCE